MLAKHKKLIYLIGFFAVLYTSISIVNNYLFRTNALDLGVYTRAMYQYAHFTLADTSSFQYHSNPMLADHFDLYLVLLSPLVLLFKSYALLIVQILALLFGGIGVYKYLTLKFGNSSPIPWLGALYFYSFFAVISALSFDYHSNVVAACFIPFLLLAINKSNFRYIILFFFIIIIAKENMSLWLTFILMASGIKFRKKIKLRNLLFLLTFVSLTYFLIITMFVMPGLSRNGEFVQFRYAALGDNYAEAIEFLLLHPIDAAKIFFTNHTHEMFGNYVKFETLVFLMLSGILFLIKKPLYILMLVPIFVQKFFHNQMAMWSFFGQYSIEFAPILAIGVFEVLGEISRKKLRLWLTGTVVVFSIGVTVRSMDNSVFYINKSTVRFYKAEHYQREYDYRSIYNGLKLIPNDAIVSVQSPFFPHLACRPKVYSLPIIKDAEFLVYSKYEGYYPYNNVTDFQNFINKTISENNWVNIYEDDSFYIYQLKKG